jgi:hypothetical protein
MRRTWKGLVYAGYSVAIAVSGFAEEVEVKELAQLAADNAVAHLSEAVTRDETRWVSMPGAIALFGFASDPSGRPGSFYKLYSNHSPWARLADELTSDIPQDWERKVVRFVDLNAPVEGPDGSFRLYPGFAT